MDGWNTNFLLGWPIFRGYVSFRECSGYTMGIHKNICEPEVQIDGIVKPPRIGSADVVIHYPWNTKWSPSFCCIFWDSFSLQSGQKWILYAVKVVFWVWQNSSDQEMSRDWSNMFVWLQVESNHGVLHSLFWNILQLNRMNWKQPDLRLPASVESCNFAV